MVGHRQTAHILAHQWAKQYVSLTKFWPLPLIDGEGKDSLTAEEMFDRNKKIEDAIKRLGISLN